MSTFAERLHSLREKARPRVVSPVGGRGGGPDLALDLAGLTRAKRVELANDIERRFGAFDPAHVEALVEVPRERFVRPIDSARSAEDVPLPLDDSGLATISAPHAYLLSYRLLGLAAGDCLVELGAGSGYGAALASRIVGASGRVRTFEIDGALAGRARSLTKGLPNVEVFHSDAMHSANLWGSGTKVVATFAVCRLPDAWLSALQAIPGGVLVAPVGQSERVQRLVRVVREREELATSDHGAVRYVSNRSQFTEA